MTPELRRARDLELLDRVDRFQRAPLQQNVWRVARTGRDPLLGAASRSRWCNGTFDVLYTSTERDGAVAEIHALFTHQPVFPSKISALVHHIAVTASSVLRIDDFDTLGLLGIDVSRYKERNYQRTQEIADAAYFLGFDGLVAPSARWQCSSVVLFTDRVPAESMSLLATEEHPVDWDAWRRQNRIATG